VREVRFNGNPSRRTAFDVGRQPQRHLRFCAVMDRLRDLVRQHLDQPRIWQ
jgi:hypothetical protein